MAQRSTAIYLLSQPSINSRDNSTIHEPTFYTSKFKYVLDPVLFKAREIENSTVNTNQILQNILLRTPIISPVELKNEKEVKLRI